MSSIISNGDPQARLAATASLLQSGSIAGCVELIGACVDESTFVGTSKPILMAMVEFAFENDNNPAFAVPLCEAVLEKTRPRITSFGEEALRVREVLADYYEDQNRLKEAVGVLRTIPMEPGLRSASEEYKASVWVRIAELGQRLDDIVLAESFVSKAWTVLKAVKDKETKLRFYVCYASVSDTKRRFLDAAQRYMELSHELENYTPALQKAVVCLVLADAGPQRSRLLGSLYKDERSTALGDLHTILTKVYHARVLRPHDVALLQPYLAVHHKAINAAGQTAVEAAILQHNLQAASKLYHNISLLELGCLLGTDADTAEEVAAHMIAEGRLTASIDQVSGFILFASDASAPVDECDTQVSAACNSISAVADTICQLHPQFASFLAA